VGAAAGDYRHATAGVETAGEQLYWNYDRELKRLQSRTGSLTAVSGGLYAVRRELFVPPPVGVTDDFFIAAQVALAHRRIVFAPDAVGYGPPVEAPAAEFRRKVRVISRGLRAVWFTRDLLNPMVYGFYAVQLLSHKVLRRLMVLPLIGLLVSSLVLWPTAWLYQTAALAQLCLHGGATAGYFLIRSRRRPATLLRVLLHFDMIQIACLAACAALLSGQRTEIWHTARAGAK
jgi:cellulose synthase/poly-beta-1,6-N-acetylglucosamine synthase-like glycosyltransferase